MEGCLDDGTIGKVVSSSLLTWENSCKISVEYMAFDLEELELIWQNNISTGKPDATRAIADVLKTFRGKTEAKDAKQKLAFYLRDSKLVDQDGLKEVLGEGNQEYPRLQPKTKKKFNTRMLGKLAYFSTRAVESVALSGLEVDFDEIDEKRFSASRSSWLFNLAIFVVYANKPESNRENLKEILLKSGQFNPYKINDIFDEDDAQVDTATGSGNAEQLVAGGTSGGISQESGDDVTDHQDVTEGGDTADGNASPQKVNNEGTWTTQSVLLLGVFGICFAVVCARIFGQVSPIGLQTILGTIGVAALARYLFICHQRVNPTISEIDKFLLASSVYPVCQPCRKLVNYYECLNFGEIRNMTKLWNDRRPVVIAVLDTGMDEGHKKLKGKILEDQSKCFVDGEESDLRHDKNGHGTMVAGVIAENGPENILIINLKIMTKDGKGCTKDIVEALNYIETLTIHRDGRVYGVDIVNMSLGQYQQSQDLNAILAKLSANKILVAAAGNDAAKMSDAVNHPAQHDGVISVGAHDLGCLEASLSSRGRRIDVLCPGVYVCSARTRSWLGDLGHILAALGIRSMFVIANGTSLASPYAVAVAAHVLLETDGKRGPNDRKHICNTMIMRKILRKLTKSEEAPYEVLRAYEEGFEHDDVVNKVDRALKH